MSAPVGPFAMLALVGALAGCGSGSADKLTTAERAREAAETAPQPSSACPATVMHTLAEIAKHVYHEGVSSERTRAASKAIAGSHALRQAAERGDAAAAQAAAQALVRAGHITNLRLISGAAEGGRVLADAGGGAVAPLRGTLLGASGAPLATYTTSVWSDEGIVAETNGIAQASTVVRAGGRTVAGSLRLPAGELPAKGTLTAAGVSYRYSSIGVERFPSGPARIYLFRPARAVGELCGGTARATLVNTLRGVAHVIYAGEGGSRAQTQVRRVERDPALLRAVAARDGEATRLAIDNLLTEHIVRLRVSVEGKLLRDVGGPYVLAPVPGVLKAAGREIGSFVLSIQDDEGYLRLTRRLAGLYVLMYMGEALVKNSLGPNPGAVPESGPFTYRGRRFEVFPVHASAFPSGPLLIKVLVPIPYS
ncbi:MAG TPA: hypothetical protein VNZ05_05140 [Solirubrobacteraceae bacterium]|nr:hypothetical protein [Solirubrobacteraceae bacterium]